MDYYIYFLGTLLLNAPAMRLTAHIGKQYLILQYCDKAPDAGRYIVSWGAKADHDCGIPHEDYDFVSAYDLHTLIDRAAINGMLIDEQHISLNAWRSAVIITQPRSADWMAYIAGSSGKWEAGRTEVEAIGKLYAAHPDLFALQRDDK